MKKVLLLAIALFSLGIAPNVIAEEEVNQINKETSQENLKWELDPNQYNNENNIPVTIDNNNLTITLPKGWSVSFLKNKGAYNPLKVNDKDLSYYDDSSTRQNGTNDRVGKEPNTSPRVFLKGDNNKELSFIYNDNKGEAGLPITVTLQSPQEGDELTLRYRADTGFYGGSSKLKDSETLKKVV